MDITYRSATEKDAEEILGIYSYYIMTSAITFEYEVPSLEEFRERIRSTLKEYPYIVAVSGGRVIGYIYASRFRSRDAYRWAAATSIYIDRDYHRLGIGRTLYERLERILREQHVTNVYPGASSPMGEEDEYLTRTSEKFHASLGYKTVARYHGVGAKFGRWYDVLEMEKIIGDKTCLPLEFIPFPELEPETGSIEYDI